MKGIKKEELPIILDSKDIQEILNIGRRQTNELLNNPPFHVERVGKRGLSKCLAMPFLDGSGKIMVILRKGKCPCVFRFMMIICRHR